jgi:hypothetical protein
MLERLQQDPLKFVSARVSLGANGLQLEPIALIFQTGETRQMLQPWLAPPGTRTASTPQLTNIPTRPQIPDNSPISTYLLDLRSALQDLWLIGLERCDAQHLRQWQSLVERGEAIGFHTLLKPIDRLTSSLNHRFQSLQWDSSEAQESLTIITLLSQVSAHLLAT